MSVDSQDKHKTSDVVGETNPEKAVTDHSGPRLDKIDASAGRFRKVLPKDAWAPGLIEVVFNDPNNSGIQDWNFVEEKERHEFSKAWPEQFRGVLQAHGLVSWKPSFPQRYPWTEGADEKIQQNYQERGHSKFITLNFPPDAETLRIADELRELPEIEQAVAIPRVGPPSPLPAEPLMGAGDQPVNICDAGFCLPSQWYIFRCKVDQAWQINNASGEGVSGKGVIIAAIDWGFNPDHQDLRAQIKKTQNVLLNLPAPTNVANGNRCHHGTAVLGVAGAQVNSLGIAGIAFGADLWAIQAGLDDIEDHSRWVAGIDFACNEATKARKVIILEVETISGGNIEMIPTIAHEIKRAINERNVVCVPAGNRGGDAGMGDDNRPIQITDSILVGATDFDPAVNVRGTSNHGCRVVVYAPGDLAFDVTCGLMNDGYLPGFGGTSSAVAKVAGVVALMLETNPALRHEQVRDILARSEIKVFDDSSNQIGVLLDAEQAVCAASQLAGRPC